MQLQSIKLVGFKSFVDPTTVALKSNLVAVVGPNGSGKSNIIDAVRWVMGESSAKHLRGESMADVIFNGSSGRKPAAYAAIELVFDNTAGKLGGQYASYATISIKREVTRDGQSNYYLNGTRCRRKDIKDIFLGTGLGPRSYAIIMQDTISRLIEAKPEEFRNYIEEVAGISKYKERRHETELRIKHTRENLDRLNDLREELAKQLSHLDRQAKAAERYKVLKQEERLTKGQLQGLQWRELAEQAQIFSQALLELETEHEKAIAVVRHIDADFERLRDTQVEASEAVNNAQEEYYQIGAEIGRYEQAKQHQFERKQQLSEDYQQLKFALDAAQQQLMTDKSQLTTLLTQEQTLKPQRQQAEQEANTANIALGTHESALRQWQQQWDEFNENSLHARQQVEVEQTRIQHLGQRYEELCQQIDTLEIEQSSFDFIELEQKIVAIQKQASEKANEQEEIQHQLSTLQNQIQKERDTLSKLRHEIDNAKNQLQQNRGKYASLEALQQAALGQNKNAVVAWLQQNNLDKKARLAECIKVVPGWEKAVETVLGHYLEAVCLEDLHTTYNHLPNLNQGNLTLLDTLCRIPANPSDNSLATKVVANDVITAILANIIAATDLIKARELLPNLQPHQSVITSDGIWLGMGWIRIAHGQEAQSGVIGRQNEMNALKQKINQLETHVTELTQTELVIRESLHEFEQQSDRSHQHLRECNKLTVDLRAQLQLKQGELGQQQRRLQELIDAIAKAKMQRETTQVNLATAKTHWQQAAQSLEKDNIFRQNLLAQRDKLHGQVDIERARTKELNDLHHQLALRYESISTQIQSLQQNIHRHESNLQELVSKTEKLQNLLANMDKPLKEIQQQLTAALEKQLIAEKTLIAARQKLASIDHDLRELTQNRHEAEVVIENLRNELEQKRLNSANIEVRKHTLEEQVGELGFSMVDILKEIPTTATIFAWQEQLSSIERRITKLGPINLAAIDEFKEITTRKTYLDAQNADLEDALNTLENAIRKIDKETRQKFKDTYDQVNQHFQALFPKIFGGGSASLDLTGEDLLETGVAIMARPPGKRNSTIHLLSGGEKALTALALVFSLFQINPAPFCLLDEVDAPLDDANIGRFCNLVQEMSKDLQFLFISHNKLAIEMGNQLIGVTMREPGVSRLVAVDVAEAVAMAEA